ncbi:MAG TPA: alpha/beta hydrolase [Kofleriaceae bacterium]
MRQAVMTAAVRRAMRTRWLVDLVGRKRTDPGLDRQIAAALEVQRLAKLPSLESMEPPAARHFAEAGLSPMDLAPEPMDQVIDLFISSIPVRVYVPFGATGDWFVYFHGGGGVIGSIAASEPVARYLAAKTRCTVASVEYRLGPEHKHPAAIEDASTAFAGLAERVPPGRQLIAGGDSFGGFLTAHVDHHALMTGKRQPDLQVLIYPLVDLTLTSPSIERFADGYLLTKPTIYWFRENYMHASDDRRAGSPWFWTDLAGSAPAIVATAGFDPLVDEGDAWVDRLRAAGTSVRHHANPSLVHGFLAMAGAVDAAHAATDRICAEVVSMLRASSSTPRSPRSR